MKRILESIASKSAHWNQSDLIALVNAIRPGSAGVEHSIDQLHHLLALLRAHPEYKKSLAEYIMSLIADYDPINTYTVTGILPNRNFIWELKRRLEYKALPPALDQRDLSILINSIFYDKHDYKWINALPEDLLLTIMDELDIQEHFGDPGHHESILNAISILSNQIFTISLEPENAHALLRDNAMNSPFSAQAKAIAKLMDFLSEEGRSSDKANDLLMQASLQLNECEFRVHELHKYKKTLGTSLHQTYVNQRLLQQILRLKLLLKQLFTVGEAQFNRNLLQLSKALIEAENKKYNVRNYIKTNIELLAFQVVSHTASGGEKYIAENRKQYGKFLLASMYGGLFIALFACFKSVIDSWDLALAGSAIAFSLNYAACFILVSFTGGIIATKQPALTASTLARCMDASQNANVFPARQALDLEQLKDIIVRVSNSQFISLVGNLLCAFSIGYAISLVFELSTGASVISEMKANKLIGEIQPHTSLALWYAALTGVFLSASGFISGFFDNRIIYEQIPRRLKEHPSLQRIFSEERLERIASYIQKNFGKFMGNFSLGLFLGSAGIIGYITGLPIDIRHIAFSAGNFGMALETLGLGIGWSAILISFSGIILIGLINFLVSFGITLFIAMRSRKITFFQTKRLTAMVFGHFLKRPLDFFLPRKQRVMEQQTEVAVQ